MRSNGLAYGIWRARSQRETTQFPFRRSLNSVLRMRCLASSSTLDFKCGECYDDVKPRNTFSIKGNTIAVWVVLFVRK
jgi:hypothetical protein